MIYNIITLFLALGFSVPLFIAMFEWSYMFHGKDIGDLNRRLRTTYFGFLVALIFFYVLSSAIIVFKLLKANKSGASGGTGKKMLKYIIAQTVFFSVLAA